MPDYQKTKIYKIVVGEGLYFGKTTMSLEQRRAVHVCDAKKSNTKLYKAMREANMKPNDIKLILIEHYPCKDKKEASAREHHWIQQSGSLNMYDGRSRDPNYQKNYRIKHKEKARQYGLKYYAKYKENKKAYAKQYRLNNLQHVNDYAKKYGKQYRANKMASRNQGKENPLYVLLLFVILSSFCNTSILQILFSVFLNKNETQIILRGSVQTH